MIHIIADTTSTIPPQKAAELGIAYLPQIIVFQENSYRDDTEIDSTTFLTKLRASNTLPKTAAPPPALYTPIFEALATPENTLIIITPSSEVSGTFRSATVAAQDFPNADIRIIDSRTIASGLASIVIQAVEWVNQGLSADSVEANIRDMCSRNHVYFVVDTLEYLYKGGRIGGAQMLFGSILQVKPILKLQDGKTQPVESQRTQKRAFARLKEIITAECPRSEKAFLTIGQGDALADAQKFAEDLKQILGVKDIPIYELPPAILVHAGPGVLSFSFFAEESI